MKKILMARGADKVVSTCVKVKPGEKVLIITEASRLSIAEAIAAAVYRVQAEPILQVMVPRDTDGQEPPAPVAAAMKASDAFISVVGRSITHTHAVKDAIAGGSRGVVLTQFTEDMMIPVSYTHLDVYKRQVMTPAAATIVSRPNTSMTRNNLSLSIWFTFSFTFITSVLFLPNQGDLFRNVSNIFIKITQDIFCLPACLCLLVGGLLAHAVAVSDSL